MNEILEYVKSWGDEIDTLFNDDGSISHIYWTFEKHYFCVTEPHSGNHYNYLLRVANKETFDRWSGAEVEIYAKNPQQIILTLIEYV